MRNEGSIHRAAKVYKWFPYLPGFAVRYDILSSNPSHAVRIKKPESRTQTWEPNQVMAYIDKAWNDGERGFACIVAIIYDTSLRPSDARMIGDSQIHPDADLEGGHHLARHQVKAGRPVKLPLWPETAALIGVYRESLAFDLCKRQIGAGEARPQTTTAEQSVPGRDPKSLKAGVP